MCIVLFMFLMALWIDTSWFLTVMKYIQALQGQDVVLVHLNKIENYLKVT